MSKSINFTFTPTTPLWATTPREYFRDYRRQLEAHKAAGRAVEAEPAPPTPKAYKVPVWFLTGRTKSGSISSGSTMGKVVNMLEPWGWEIHAARSSAVTWIGAAHHGYRVLVVGSRITLNGEVVTIDELKERFGA